LKSGVHAAQQGPWLPEGGMEVKNAMVSSLRRGPSLL